LQRLHDGVGRFAEDLLQRLGNLGTKLMGFAILAPRSVFGFEKIAWIKAVVGIDFSPVGRQLVVRFSVSFHDLSRRKWRRAASPQWNAIEKVTAAWRQAHVGADVARACGN
jgi:hypothetical protein